MDVQQSIAGIKSIQGALQVLALLQLTAHRFPPQATVTDGDSFDFIVVGAGSAGCVLANRLTEDPNVRVLLVEAGGDPPLESVLPSLWTYLQDSPMDWNYTTVNDGYSTQCHANKVFKATRGKMLGGSSSINGMLYLRGDPEDFNDWARITKDKSWRYENILKYFKKSERLEDDEIMRSDTISYHGTSGYMGVTRQTGEELIPVLKSFAETGQKYVLDFNGNNTLGYGELTFTKAGGVRQSTAQSFLSPIRNRKNLFILKKSLCTKILFDEHKSATGVEIIDQNNSNLKFFVKNEVMISAGAINSPQLLMLSGIGPEEHLKSFQIPVVSNLQVGQNLQDHVAATLFLIMDKVSNSNKPTNPHDNAHTIHSFASLDKYYLNRDYQSMLTLLPAKSVLNTCSHTCGFDDYICQKLFTKSRGKQVAFVNVKGLSPKSRGEILLQNRNPKVSPLIDLKAFSNSIDLNNTVRYVKDFLKLADTSYFKNAILFQPDCLKNLKLGSDEYWRKYILCMSMTLYHYSGTCAMGSVLDSRFRVLGVSRLRVVDASAMPTITRANTNANVIMMAEKAADLIKEGNGLKL